MKIKPGFVSNSSSSSFVLKKSKANVDKSIISLQEISANSWKALYQGNYGVYTIKIKTDGEKTIEFSCSCPSSGHPCKHIHIIEKAIKQHIDECEKDGKQEIKFEQLLKDLSKKELYDFIVRQAKYDPQLKNKILLEFTEPASSQTRHGILLS